MSQATGKVKGDEQVFDIFITNSGCQRHAMPELEKIHGLQRYFNRLVFDAGTLGFETVAKVHRR